MKGVLCFRMYDCLHSLQITLFDMVTCFSIKNVVSLPKDMNFDIYYTYTSNLTVSKHWLMYLCFFKSFDIIISKTKLRKCNKIMNTCSYCIIALVLGKYRLVALAITRTDLFYGIDPFPLKKLINTVGVKCV